MYTLLIVPGRKNTFKIKLNNYQCIGKNVYTLLNYSQIEN